MLCREAAVLLGGCGDARHLLATLIDAAAAEGSATRLRGSQLRITVNDITPEQVARVYVLLLLLQRAADTLPDTFEPLQMMRSS